MRRPSLPRLVLWLGGAAPFLIVASLVLGISSALLTALSPPLGESMTRVAMIGLAGGLVCAVVGIVTGHVARRRHPGEATARLGLILAYCTAGGFIGLGLIAVGTWLWMMQHYR